MADDKKNDVPFDPAGLMEKAFLMGIGVLEMTREKTEGFADELIERGKMSKSDAKKVADRISEMAGEAAGGGPQDGREGDRAGHEDRRRRHQDRGRRPEGADRRTQGDAGEPGCDGAGSRCG